MNNENPNLEPVQNNVEVPEVGATTPASDAPAFQTIDPTADFQTVDPTATEVQSPAPEGLTPTPSEAVPVEAAPALPTEAAPVTEELTPVDVTAPIAPAVDTAQPAETEATSTVPPAAYQPPKANPVDMSSFEAGSTRYNPVTGEEMDMNAVANGTDGTNNADAVNNEEKLKKVEVEYKPSGKGSSILVVFFFIGLIAFVVFLPDIQNMIALRKAGNTGPKEIVTGTLVCELETNTTNLDHAIKREFAFTDKKLQSAKFTTTIRGDITLDEEALDTYNEQCTNIHNNVEGLQGVTVSCDYKDGKLIEKESFDYSIYDFQNVSAAYIEAGGSVLEFQYEQDIDKVMTMMLQGGFDCEKKQ